MEEPIDVWLVQIQCLHVSIRQCVCGLVNGSDIVRHRGCAMSVVICHPYCQTGCLTVSEHTFSNRNGINLINLLQHATKCLLSVPVRTIYSSVIRFFVEPDESPLAYNPSAMPLPLQTG